jgi:hypothetical protein
MNSQTQRKPTAANFSLLRQLCNLIPNHLVPQLACEHVVEERSRTFRPWSHVVSLIYAQLTHSLGLNDVCDALRLHSGPLSAIRGATPPSKNALLHANRERNPKMAEALFWTMLEHLQQLHPGFLSQWSHSFTRLFTLIRSALWQRLDLRQLLDRYGPAGGGGRFLGTPQQAYLPGIT